MCNHGKLQQKWREEFFIEGRRELGGLEKTKTSRLFICWLATCSPWLSSYQARRGNFLLPVGFCCLHRAWELSISGLPTLFNWSFCLFFFLQGLTCKGEGKVALGIIIRHPSFFWASLVAQTVKNLAAIWETWVQSLGWEDPLDRGYDYPLQYSCLENFHGQRRLSGYSP